MFAYQVRKIWLNLTYDCEEGTERNMHGRQASDERLYLARDKGERGLKSMKDMYKETKVRIA